MTTSSRPVLRAAPDDPVAGHMVFVGCSRRKLTTAAPVSALELYQGGAVPALRARVGTNPHLRARVRILSAEHGLLTADTPLLAYDRPLTAARASELYPNIGAALMTDLLAHGVPRAVLVVAEPLYLSLIVDLFVIPEHRPTLIWVPHDSLWPHAAAVLDRWGWP